MAASLVPAEIEDRLDVSSRPHTTNAIEMTPVTPNTTQSRPGLASLGRTGSVIGASGLAVAGSAAAPVASGSGASACRASPVVSSDTGEPPLGGSHYTPSSGRSRTIRTMWPYSVVGQTEAVNRCARAAC